MRHPNPRYCELSSRLAPEVGYSVYNAMRHPVQTLRDVAISMGSIQVLMRLSEEEAQQGLDPIEFSMSADFLLGLLAEQVKAVAESVAHKLPEPDMPPSVQLEDSPSSSGLE